MNGTPTRASPTRTHRIRPLLAALGLVSGCAASRVATIEDHYLGGAPTDGATLPPSGAGVARRGDGPVAYHPSEVIFDPIVPLRTEPETIAVLELAHPGEDGTWIAPHYVVVLVRPEGWVGQLPPRISEPRWARPTDGRASPGDPTTVEHVGGGGATATEESR